MKNANFTKSSTNFTVPKGVKKIDCFCVGGGGGVVHDSAAIDSTSWYTYYDECGGGGGYTSTVLAVDNPKTEIPIVVGAGGSTDRYAVHDGSSSSIGSICSASGGFGSDSYSEYGSPGKNGGSGGGAGGGEVCFGGKDGGDGGSSYSPPSTVSGFTGGIGQHSTTRYFGESTGTLYSTGGSGGNPLGRGGSIYYPTSSVSYQDLVPSSFNSIGFSTGNGGNGWSSSTEFSTCGASGICIIRWSGK